MIAKLEMTLCTAQQNKVKHTKHPQTIVATINNESTTTTDTPP